MTKPPDPASPSAPDSLGALLRARRRERGLTLQALARAVETAPSYLSMIENGRVENPPSAGLLDRLEAALECFSHACRVTASRLTHPHRKKTITSPTITHRIGYHRQNYKETAFQSRRVWGNTP